MPPGGARDALGPQGLTLSPALSLALPLGLTLRPGARRALRPSPHPNPYQVSVQWVGELTPFFERAGYTFVTGNYGNAFNGYMGVALAWPTSRFTCEEMSISKLADTKPWPEGAKKDEP